MLVDSFDAGMGRGLGAHAAPEHGLPCFDHVTELPLQPSGRVRKYFEDGPAQMFARGQPVDRSEPVVYLNVPEVRVQVTEADWRPPIEMDGLFCSQPGVFPA